MASTFYNLSIDFFEYFPKSTEAAGWGIFSTACGKTVIPPGTAYPPGDHPGDHRLNWKSGRVLSAYQIVYITEGQGTFEMKGLKPFKVSADQVFLLFPRVWHRYRPDPKTGWSELWIELQGPEIRRLHRQGIIDPATPLRQTPDPREMSELFQDAHRLCLRKLPRYQVRMGLLALQMLALLETHPSAPSVATSRVDRLIGLAQNLMAQKSSPLLSSGEIAKKVGMAYSYFRRSFKRQTGFSPKQYQAEVRLHQAKELLRGSQSIQEIADILGYYSPYHLSNDFSKRTGKSPSQWRRENR